MSMAKQRPWLLRRTTHPNIYYIDELATEDGAYEEADSDPDVRLAMGMACG